MLKRFVFCGLLCFLYALQVYAQSAASDSTTIRWEGKWSTPKERFQPIPKKAILSAEILKISGEKENQNWIGIAPFAQYESKVSHHSLHQALYQQYRLSFLNYLISSILQILDLS